MNKPTNRRLTNKIFKINEELDIVQENLVKCKDAVLSNNTEMFDTNLKEGFFNAQKAYMELRNFSAECASSKKEISKQIKDEFENFNISISLLPNGIIKYSVPIILPFCQLKKYKYYPNNASDEQIFDAVVKTDAILNCISNATNEFIKRTKINKDLYQEVTLLYVNNFDRKYNIDKIPDSDNYSYKNISDIITETFCKYFDRFYCCDFVYSSRINNFTGTEIYLIPNLRIGEAVVSMICNNVPVRRFIKNEPQSDLKVA